MTKGILDLMLYVLFINSYNVLQLWKPTQTHPHISSQTKSTHGQYPLRYVRLDSSLSKYWPQPHGHLALACWSLYWQHLPVSNHLSIPESTRGKQLRWPACSLAELSLTQLSDKLRTKSCGSTHSNSPMNCANTKIPLTHGACPIPNYGNTNNTASAAQPTTSSNLPA